MSMVKYHIVQITETVIRTPNVTINGSSDEEITEYLMKYLSEGYDILVSIPLATTQVGAIKYILRKEVKEDEKA